MKTNQSGRARAPTQPPHYNPHLDGPAEGAPAPKGVVHDQGHGVLRGQGLELLEARDVVLCVYQSWQV